MDTTIKQREVSGEEAAVIISHLAILIKTADLHSMNNVAVVSAITKFLEFLNPLIRSGDITLQLTGDFFYLNGNRIRYQKKIRANIDFLKHEFIKCETGTIIFRERLSKSDIEVFVSAFSTAAVAESPFQTLTEELINIPRINVKKLKEVNEDIIDPDQKKRVRKIYSNAVSITKAVLNKIESGERINLKQSKRIIGTLTDQIMHEESKSILLGMTTIKDYDNYTYNHSVNVSILALAFGYKLKLPKAFLSVLGLAALFHDIGKIRIPKDVLNKPSTLTAGDWELIKRHPEWGAISILNMKGINEVSMNLAISAFEHHINYDSSGYPILKHQIEPELFSKIIAIVDQYDAMTSSRVYSRIPMAPDKALMQMVAGSGTKLDPHLLKQFILMVGVYPIGTLVLLDNNELGLVFENNTDQSLSDRPRVLLIADSAGIRTDNIVVNLMDMDEDGNYIRSIVKTLDANQYGINLSEYLF